MENAKEAHQRKLALEEAERKKNEEKLKINIIKEKQIMLPEIVPPQVHLNKFNVLSNNNQPSPVKDNQPIAPMENTDPRLRNGATKRKSRFAEVESHPQPVPIQQPPPAPFPSLFVGLSNIAYRATVMDIGTYFMENNCSPNRIEIIKGPKGLPCGDVVLEMKCMEDIQQALTLNNSNFYNRKILVVPITVNDVINRAGENFLRECESSRSPQQPQQQIQPPPFLNQPQQLIPNQQQPNFQNGVDFYDPRGNPRVDPRCDPRVVDPRFQPMNMNNFGNNFDEPGNNIPNNRNQMGFEPVAEQDQNPPAAGMNVPDKFNMPGRVLILQNVPYSATIEDIARFFGNFDVTPEDVIRRYNKDGSPTGDARVAFHEKYLAEAAFEQKNRQKLFNRILYLAPV